jgi:hypothetical protein
MKIGQMINTLFGRDTHKLIDVVTRPRSKRYRTPTCPCIILKAGKGKVVPGLN